MADFRNVEIIDRGRAKAKKVSLASLTSAPDRIGIFDRFIAFDVETTGIEPDKDRIIEIGAVLFKCGAPADEFQSLVKPGVEFPENVSALTRITPGMLADASEPSAVLPDLALFLGDAVCGKTLICGHVTAFDMSFLCRAFSEMGIDADLRFVDTRDIALSIPELTSHSLAAVAEHFGVTIGEAHRAKADAMTSGKILWKYLCIIWPNIKHTMEDV